MEKKDGRDTPTVFGIRMCRAYLLCYRLKCWENSEIGKKITLFSRLFLYNRWVTILRADDRVADNIKYIVDLIK